MLVFYVSLYAILRGMHEGNEYQPSPPGSETPIPRFEYPEEPQLSPEQASAAVRYPDEARVAVLRKRGDMEYWKVAHYLDDGRVMVYGIDTQHGQAVEKPVNASDLDSWQPRFHTGQNVRVKFDGRPEEAKVDGKDDQGRIMVHLDGKTDLDDKTYFFNAVDLALWQLEPTDQDSNA